MRRLLLSFGFIFLIAGTGWVIWKKWPVSGPVPSVIEANRQHEIPVPQVSEGFAPLIDLQVNDKREIPVLQGIPLVFDVSLTGAHAAPALKIGGAGTAWHKHIQLQLADTGKPLPWKVGVLGAPKSVVFRADQSDRQTIEEQNSDQAIVDKHHVHTARFGVAPEDTMQLPPGRYTVLAVLSGPSSPSGSWSGRVLSNPVFINVGERPEVDPARAPLEKERLAKSAGYYLQAGRFEDARHLALQLRSLDPQDAEAHILLADSLNGLRRDEEALHSYGQALALIPETGAPTEEPPEYILMRMNEVQERLGR